jgi:hypothetical protein
MEDISRRTTPEHVITDMMPMIAGETNNFARKKPFITYSTVVDRFTADHASRREDDYGASLADYIEANDLGEVFRDCPVRRNWTGNSIKIWIWMPNYQVMRERWLAHQAHLQAQRDQELTRRMEELRTRAMPPSPADHFEIIFTTADSSTDIQW